MRNGKFRIGEAYDIHRLGAPGPLILGGVKVLEAGGAIAHSDGDCLVHAITEALIGALGLGDLGVHFPDTDPRYRGINSLKLLEVAMGMLKENGYGIVNLDATIHLERPKLGPLIKKMKAILTPILALSDDDLNIKAATNEGVDALGAGLAVASRVCLLIAKEEK